MAQAKFSDFTFDSASPEAIRIARRVAANLVVEVSDETRAAIRQAIVNAVSRKQAPIQAAREIIGVLVRDGARAGGVAGLTRRDARAVRNFREELQNAGLSDTHVKAQTRRFAEKKLKDRASTIARTETMNALNAGQDAAWKQQQKKGLLGKNAQKEWIVTPDDRLCQICAPLDGETVPIAKNFSVGVPNPPAHPRCRCAHGISDPFSNPKRETSIDVQERLSREGAPGADPDFRATDFRDKKDIPQPPPFGATRRPPGGSG